MEKLEDLIEMARKTHNPELFLKLQQQYFAKHGDFYGDQAIVMNNSAGVNQYRRKR